jgi:Fumarase
MLERDEEMIRSSLEYLRELGLGGNGRGDWAERSRSATTSKWLRKSQA